MQIYRYTDIWFFCENLKKTKTATYRIWRLAVFYSIMIPQNSRVSYLEKFIMVQTHRANLQEMEKTYIWIFTLEIFQPFLTFT